MFPVTFQDGLYRSAIITGPTHAWLGVRLQEIACDHPVFTPRPAVNEGSERKLDEGRILQAVQLGVSNANSRYRSHWHLAEIAYVLDDSPRYSLYERLAFRIVAAIAENQVETLPSTPV